MNLSDMKVPELREKAHTLGIEGVDSMKKPELIAAIEKVQPKGLIEKGLDAIEKVLHPKAVENDEEADAEPEGPQVGIDLKAKEDYAKHPKFSKFKKQETP